MSFCQEIVSFYTATWLTKPGHVDVSLTKTTRVRGRNCDYVSLSYRPAMMCGPRGREGYVSVGSGERVGRRAAG